jgi:hypothetical protein
LFGRNDQQANDILLKTATKQGDPSGKASDLHLADVQRES